jgi:peptidoglycan hydrolase-like protein with peptidoglycan-binding domain
MARFVGYLGVLLLTLALFSGSASAQSFLDSLRRGAQNLADDLEKLDGTINPPPPNQSPTVDRGGSDPALSQNGNRELVLDVQLMLRELGYDVGTPDGLYCRRTSQSIMAFEGSSGLPQTGNVTQELQAQLQAKVGVPVESLRQSNTATASSGSGAEPTTQTAPAPTPIKIVNYNDFFAGLTVLSGTGFGFDEDKYVDLTKSLHTYENERLGRKRSNPGASKFFSADEL